MRLCRNLFKTKCGRNLALITFYQKIKHHGGVTEAVLVIQNTLDVIEGNSRLAALRKLSREDPDNQRWTTIPCKIVSELTPPQLDSYLHQTHVISITPWTAYEKANLAYKRIVEDNESVEEYAKNISESVQAIKNEFVLSNSCLKTMTMTEGTSATTKY